MSEMDGVCVSKLIDLVRDRPVLWDRQEEVYKNRKLTKKAWTEICEALLENYAELPDEDQKSFGRNVIGKWANLRDNWLRYWRKRQDHIRAGTLNSRFKKYIHHDQLMFLSKVYNDQAEAEIQQEVEEIQVEVDVLSDPGSDSPLGFSSEEASQTPWSYIGATEEVVRTPWTVPILREPPPVAIPSLNEERHLYFYQSTLPLIADFDENQTLDFHASVLESIRRVRSGKQPVNLVQTPQPAYILAIAQPQGFLPSTELKPKAIATSSSKQDSETSVDTVPMKDARYCNEPIQVSNSSQSTLEFPPQEALQELHNKAESNSPYQTRLIKKSTSADVSTDADFKSVVNKLDEISKTFETALCGDSFDKFGKYVGSFLRTLPIKRAKMLKRRIVRQILRVQLLERKSSTAQSIKPVEIFNQADSKERSDVTNKTLLSEEKVSSSSLENSFMNSCRTQVYEPSKSIIKIRPESKPIEAPKNCSLMDVPRLVTCNVCGQKCISSADLLSHCSSQHKGFTLSFTSQAEPVVKRRRGRPPKRYNPDVTM